MTRGPASPTPNAVKRPGLLRHKRGPHRRRSCDGRRPGAQGQTPASRRRSSPGAPHGAPIYCRGWTNGSSRCIRRRPTHPLLLWQAAGVSAHAGPRARLEETVSVVERGAMWGAIRPDVANVVDHGSAVSANLRPPVSCTPSINCTPRRAVFLTELWMRHDRIHGKQQRARAIGLIRAHRSVSLVHGRSSRTSSSRSAPGFSAWPWRHKNRRPP